jgi:hypothetical protein
MKIIESFLITGMLTCTVLSAFTQATEKKDPLLTVGYRSINNREQYVFVNAKVKVNRRFQPVPLLSVKVYVDSLLIGSGTLNDAGFLTLPIPAAAQQVWRSGDTHKLMASSAANKDYNEASGDATVNKARITIDTGDSKVITAKVEQLANGNWIPLKDVAVKIGVRRLDADLAVADKESYTTDSTGVAAATFTHEGLPGNSKGDITLVAKVVDNENIGSLEISKQVQWGAPTRYVSNFGKRTLFATRFKTPVWLLVMAYGIFLTAWSVIIYLISQVFRIRKVGLQS